VVLIVSNKEDLASDIVVLAIQELKGEVIRLNLEDAADWRITISPQLGTTLSDGSHSYEWQRITSVWCRRPGWPRLDAAPGTIGEFINEQWMTLLRGLSCVPGPVWVNHPFSAAAAENKILQLMTAKEVGLDIPETIVSNSAQQVIDLSRNQEDIIVKALTCPLIEDTGDFVFTTLIDNAKLPSEEAASIAPFISQRALLPKIDIRATIIGGTCFAAEARSSLVDWRLDRTPNLWQSCELPGGIVDKLFALMERLGLRFGAFDLALHEDRHYFLEVNPTGEWAWIQWATEMNLAGGLARYLMRPCS
jgi:hypothetical protein